MSEDIQEAVKLNLYQKISAVMKDVEYLSKDDAIEFKTTKYKAISEEKVTMAVRASLIKHGLVILPVNQSHSRTDTLTTVDVTYKIVDIDTGQSEMLSSSGTGVDTQDKGVGKAMTYSYKYLLLRTFAIPTGEDPDKVSSAELDESQRIANEKHAKEERKPSTQNMQQQSRTTTETQSGSTGHDLASESQAKMLSVRASNAKVSLDRIADHVGYVVTDTKEVRRSDVNKVLKMIDECKAKLTA